MPLRKLGTVVVEYTPEVEAVLERAREEAARLGHPYLSVDHQLLGLLSEGASIDGIFARLEKQPETARELLQKSLVRGGGKNLPVAELADTSRARTALVLAWEEAQAMEFAAFAPEHLLLGVFREEKSLAAQALRRMGISLEALRDAVREVALTGTPAVRLVEIDDHSDVPIYEQIIARIQEAIATGRLRAGDRMPAVRQLADELEIAPGTVARAYRDLEGAGLLITDGARGTRVAERQASVGQRERDEELTARLRPLVVEAYHLGATADDVARALRRAMQDVFPIDE